MIQDIYETIKKRILYFDYPPRTKLNETSLAQEFNVSRTPVREVLLRLEWEKLVTIIPRAGIIVTDVDFKQLREVFQVRLVLEGELGHRAAMHITDEDLAQMQKLHTLLTTITSPEQFRLLVDTNYKFRNIISTAAQNDILYNITDLLYYQTRRVWYMIYEKIDFNALVEAERDEIERGIAVFSQKNPELCSEYRRDVIKKVIERFSTIL